MRNITKPHKGNYLKHVLIVVGVALPTLLIFIFLFVIPFGAKYKEIKRDVKLVERDLKLAEMKYNKEKSKLGVLRQDNSLLLYELRNPKSIKKFQEDNLFIKKIIPLKERWEDGKLFKKEVYQLETDYLYTTLDSIYDLMENSKEYGMRFVVDFPIEFEAKKRKIRSKLTFAVYKLKPIIRDLVRPFTEIQK